MYNICRLTDALTTEEGILATQISIGSTVANLKAPNVPKTRKQELANLFTALAKEQNSKQRTDETFEFIERLLKNVADNPEQEKFRKIKMVRQSLNDRFVG